MHRHVHNSAIHNSQVLISRGADKEMGSSYNRILFGHKKERKTDARYDVDEPQNHHAERKKPDTKDILCMTLFI